MNNLNRIITPEILEEMINHTKCIIGRCQQQIDEPDTYYDHECAKQEIGFFRCDLHMLETLDLDKHNKEYLKYEAERLAYEKEQAAHQLEWEEDPSEDYLF